MPQFAFYVALLTTVFLAGSPRAQPTTSRQLGPEDGLLVVAVDGKCGFIDLAGRIIIDGSPTPPGGLDVGPPIGSFREGVAAVSKDGSWRFIDASGRVALPGQFSKVSNSGFRNGVAQVCGSKACGYIDRTGRAIWPWD